MIALIVIPLHTQHIHSSTMHLLMSAGDSLWAATAAGAYNIIRAHSTWVRKYSHAHVRACCARLEGSPQTKSTNRNAKTPLAFGTKAPEINNDAVFCTSEPYNTIQMNMLAPWQMTSCEDIQWTLTMPLDFLRPPKMSVWREKHIKSMLIYQYR